MSNNGSLLTIAVIISMLVSFLAIGAALAGDEVVRVGELSGYETIQEHTISKPQQPIANLVNASSVVWTVVDDPNNSRTNITAVVIGIAGTYNKVDANTTNISTNRERLNLINGTNITIRVIDDSSQSRTNITISSTGGGGVSGSGTTNRLAKWTASTTLGNSLFSDDGTTITALGNIDVNSNRLQNVNDEDFITRTSDPSALAGLVWFRDTANGVFKFFDNQGTPATRFFMIGASDEGGTRFSEPFFNCVGANVVCTDDIANNEIDVTVSGGGGGTGTLEDIQLEGITIVDNAIRINYNDTSSGGISVADFSVASEAGPRGTVTVIPRGLIQAGDAADSGQIRLINAASFCSEANPANGDLCFTFDGSNNAVFNSNIVNMDFGSNPFINTILRSGSTGNFVIAEPSFAVCTALGATIPLTGGGTKTQIDLTNSDPWTVRFADGSTQTMHCDFRVRSDIDTAETWDVIIYWHSSTASTNNVRWSVSTCTPAVGVTIDCAFGTASASNCAGQGTTRLIASCALTITSANHSVAIDDVIKMQIQRIGADAGDNFAGDADLAMVLIEWN